MKNGEMQEKPIPICQFRNTYLKFSGCHHICKTNPCNPINTCKLDSGVKMRREISKKENIFGFFGYDI
jgi:hypothetical protein